MGNSYQDHRINIGMFYNKRLKFSRASLCLDGRSDCTSRLEIKTMRMGRRIKSSSGFYIKMVLLLALFIVNVQTGVQKSQNINYSFLKNEIKCRPCEPMTKSVEIVNHNF